MPGDNLINLDNLKTKKVNRTHSQLLVGEAILYKEIDNSYEFTCLAYNKAGNDYKLMPYKFGPQKFCDFVSTEKTLYPEVKAVSDFPDYETCPWPAGVYHINGFQPDFSKIPPVIGSGDYMLECTVGTFVCLNISKNSLFFLKSVRKLMLFKERICMFTKLKSFN